MKGVDTIARARREFLAHGRTITEIARDLHRAEHGAQDPALGRDVVPI